MSEPSSRILFIGNSFTDFNGGVDQDLKRLEPSIAIERLAPGGYTLEGTGTRVRRWIASAWGWNYVVLQEQSQAPVTARGELHRICGQIR